MLADDATNNSAPAPASTSAQPGTAVENPLVTMVSLADRFVYPIPSILMTDGHVVYKLTTKLSLPLEDYLDTARAGIWPTKTSTRLTAEYLIFCKGGQSRPHGALHFPAILQGLFPSILAD
jgi:hypothetical protein